MSEHDWWNVLGGIVGTVFYGVIIVRLISTFRQAWKEHCALKTAKPGKPMKLPTINQFLKITALAAPTSFIFAFGGIGANQWNGFRNKWKYETRMHMHDHSRLNVLIN
jgi:CDP-diglyceride synthetase